MGVLKNHLKLCFLTSINKLTILFTSMQVPSSPTFLFSLFIKHLRSKPPLKISRAKIISPLHRTGPHHSSGGQTLASHRWDPGSVPGDCHLQSLKGQQSSLNISIHIRHTVVWLEVLLCIREVPGSVSAQRPVTVRLTFDFLDTCKKILESCLKIRPTDFFYVLSILSLTIGLQFHFTYSRKDMFSHLYKKTFLLSILLCNTCLWQRHNLYHLYGSHARTSARLNKYSEGTLLKSDVSNRKRNFPFWYIDH